MKNEFYTLKISKNSNTNPYTGEQVHYTELNENNIPPFTYVLDVDRIILLNVKNDNTLENLCATNMYARSICNENSFWNNKINNIYPNFPIPKSLLGDTKKLYYKIKRFSEKDMLRWAEGNKYVDIVEWIATNNKFLDISAVNLLAEYGKLDTLKFVMVNYHIYPDVNGANSAAKNGHLDILILLEKHSLGKK